MIVSGVTIICAAGLAIIAWSFRKIPIGYKILAAILVIIILLGQVYTLIEEKKAEQHLKYSGILKGPAVTVLSTAQEIYPRLKLGNSNAFFVHRGPEAKRFFRIFDDNELIMWTKNGELKLSTEIRDIDGQLIAKIVGNEWKLRKDKLWDRNYTKNAIEVKNGKGDVVLQMIMKDDCIQFAAKMYSSTGAGFAIGSQIFTEEDVREHDKGTTIIVAAEDETPWAIFMLERDWHIVHSLCHCGVKSLHCTLTDYSEAVYYFYGAGIANTVSRCILSHHLSGH